MANKKHLEILMRGVDIWREWRRENPEIRPDLSGENLSDANLVEANLTFADLSGAKLMGTRLAGANLSWGDLQGASLVEANLTGAQLAETDLRAANLERAVLAGADLRKAKLGGALLLNASMKGANLSEANLHTTVLAGASLDGAILSGADLTESNLIWADLTRATLDGANVSKATFGNTSLGTVNLSDVAGLELVEHGGPSTIGIGTIYLSKGKIPEIFLRGAGVPESFITYMKSLVVNPIEYYSCFISYSSRDEEFAKRLHRDLQGEQVRCWFAPEDLKIGDRIRPEIDEAIRVHDKLLLVLTESSMKSAWVEKEVETAFEKERKQGRTVLFPIRLDDAVMETNEAWAADIRRTRHIGDFREWKSHDRYKEGFARLMWDLKA